MSYPMAEALAARGGQPSSDACWADESGIQASTERPSSADLQGLPEYLSRGIGKRTTHPPLDRMTHHQPQQVAWTTARFRCPRKRIAARSLVLKRFDANEIALFHCDP